MIGAIYSGTIMEDRLLLFDAMHMEWHTQNCQGIRTVRCVVMETSNFKFSEPLNS